MRAPIRTLGVIALLSAAACGHVQGQDTPAPAPGARSELLPPGYGRLNQDDISLRLVSGDLEIRFIPLEERTLRLLAPDAYRALHDLRESKRTQIDSVAREIGSSAPGLALVSFFSVRDGTRFEPQDLALNAQGQQARATGFVPLSANFTSQQLSQRGTANAIFVFDASLPVFQEFTLLYQNASTDAWRSRLSLMERERDRIATRVRSAPPDSTARP